jgi:phage terminase large subunit
MARTSDILRRWRERPSAFVREQFGVEPDAWQADILDAFPHNQRLAMRCCKGPGKTCVLAWLIWNFLATRRDSNVAATSISGDQLADGLWKELAKWQHRSAFLTAAFTWTKTRITSNESPATWWASARTWPRSASPQQQADTLAGLHADRVLFVLDESGGMPDSLMATAEAALSSCVEGHLVQAGNPTHLEGPLYRACTVDRALWYVAEITGDPDDPRRSPRVKIGWAREQIAKWGRENPWVLVNVFGRFPPHSINALIGPDEVRAAMARHLRPDEYGHAPVALGVDVAREGDDECTVYRRQGRAAWKPLVLRNVDGLQGAAQVQRLWAEHEADGCFVDATGGFGSSWIDQLRVLGRHPIGVNFSAEPMDRSYLNKRAEMYFLACQWIRDGGALPDEPHLLADLVAQTYTFQKDRLMLRPKADLKLEHGRSPDHGDGFALTFAYPLVKQGRQTQASARRAGFGDYHPHEAFR